MKTRILIMRPDEPHETRDVEIEMIEDEFGRPYAQYDGLRALVEDLVGEPMEHVTVFADFDGGIDFQYADMFVNELGQLRHFRRNEAATIIYRCNWLMHADAAGEPEDLPDIVGTAVLFEKKVWG